MTLWRKKQEEKEQPLSEKKPVSEVIIDVGENRPLINLSVNVYVENGIIYTKREIKTHHPVRAAELACVIAELEQMKIMLLTDYTKGSMVASMGKKK